MNSTRSARLLALVSLPFGLLALADAAHAQAFDPRTDDALHDEDAQRIEAPRPFVPVVLEGIVLGPDGAPAVGAVVVSSAGGKAVTDQDGAYRLEVEVPIEAESAQVTAFATAAAGGGSLTASTSVGLLASRLARVAPLALTSSTTCQPSWLPTFGGLPGADYDVYAQTVFDDGSGPALYVGGGFSVVDGKQMNNIARWDGSTWSAVGGGMDGAVYALTVFDDGSGPALYAAGTFSAAGGGWASSIAKWNGATWSALGSGIDGYVFALSAFDDGSGPALYAGGTITTAGSGTANRIARWSGSSWSAVGSGMDSVVRALTVFDDGSGPKLYAGGDFSTAGGVAANRIARWNGSSWSALGAGLTGLNSAVRALTVFDDGGGPALYAGGRCTAAGGIAASNIAKWDGSSWSALDGGVDNFYVQALTAFDDGSGPALYTGGDFTAAGGVAASHIARWDGSSWSPLGSGTGMNERVAALTVFDDGSGPALYAGGAFTTAGSVAATRLAKWDGSSWSALGSGMNSSVNALLVFDDGGGPALYAGGDFTTARGTPASRIARWNGSSWSPLGSGIGGAPGDGVNALAVFDDGGGPALYAAGVFTVAGGVPASHVARWDGSSWSAVGGGVTRVVNALVVFDDGSGPALYAGGEFRNTGSGPAERIAKWNGSSWSPLGSGLSGFVHALTVFDDGSGPALYAGGSFSTATGGTANRIARWNGSSWSPLSTGIGGASGDVVNALAVFDDGSGPALYAGGAFTTAGGVAAIRIAKWNGSSWSALGSGMNNIVLSFTVFDDGSGPALYAGGAFTSAGGVAAIRIAKWNGSSWSALGSGMDSSVKALTVFDDGGGPALFAGGSFPSVLDSGDSYMAEWGCDTAPPTIDCQPVFALQGFGQSGSVVSFEVAATDAHDPSPTVACVPPSGSFFPRGTTLVTCTATDNAGNQSVCTFPVIVRPKYQRDR